MYMYMCIIIIIIIIRDIFSTIKLQCLQDSSVIDSVLGFSCYNIINQEAAVLNELEERMRHSDRLLDQKEIVVGELQSTLRKEVSYCNTYM